MNLFQKISCKLRSIYGEVFDGADQFVKCETDPQKVSDIIYEILNKDEPCLICRFGAVELYCVTNYLGVKKGPSSFFSFITGKSDVWWWMPQRFFEMKNNAGFFSSDDLSMIDRFCETFLDDLKYIDVLGSWLEKEKYLGTRLEHVVSVFLPYLEPYWAKMPWSRILEGKKVLVVHPFVEQIRKQYLLNRTKIFNNKMVLPEFSLLTLKSVQSMGGDNNGFSTWFDALDYMKEQMDNIDYDICIIGCGAYGFHLAAHAKRMGKKAVHMGGATQLLFGIKGKRWENPMYGVKEWNLPYGFYTDLFNDYWVRPDDKNKPKNAETVEGGCYW